jgi:hypothetical protein
MNWDAIGAIGEIVGALAVFLTLFYLAIQIRQNTKSNEASAIDAAMSGYAQINQVLTDPLLASIYRRGNIDPTSLSDDELVQFLAIGRMLVNSWWKMFNLYQQGAYPHNQWVIITTEADQILKSKGGQAIKESLPANKPLWDAIAKYSTGSDAISFGFELNDPSAIKANRLV